MSNVLADFLKGKAEQLRTEQPLRDRLVVEWTGAVTRLLDQLESWARESDSEGLLAFNRTTYKFNDEKMGPYTTPGLDITLDGRIVSVVPIARRLIGSIRVNGEPNERPLGGRVDIQQAGATMYTLYRVQEPESDKWVVVQPTWDSSRKQQITNPLTRDEFERDLTSLLE